MARPRNGIRAVLFDLGGTLIDRGDVLGWAELLRRCGFDVDAEALAHALPEVEREFDTPERAGQETLAEFWRRAIERASGRAADPALLDRFLAAFRSNRAPASLFTDVRRCLEMLAAGRYALGVVSNSTSEEDVRAVLDRFGILSQFSLVVSSGTEGVAKPDPEIFRRAVARLGVRPEEALYVGNLAYTDARAAAAAGLHSVWLHRDGTGFGEDPPEITSLLEVPGVVRSIEEEASGGREARPGLPSPGAPPPYDPAVNWDQGVRRHSP